MFESSLPAWAVNKMFMAFYADIEPGTTPRGGCLSQASSRRRNAEIGASLCNSLSHRCIGGLVISSSIGMMMEQLFAGCG